MTQSGLTALIGPLSSSPAHHVQCMTAQMHVPHIETRYDYSNVLSPYSINIHPHPPVLGKVSDLTIILVKDVLEFWVCQKKSLLFFHRPLLGGKIGQYISNIIKKILVEIMFNLPNCFWIHIYLPENLMI